MGVCLAFRRILELFRKVLVEGQHNSSILGKFYRIQLTSFCSAANLPSVSCR